MTADFRELLISFCEMHQFWASVDIGMGEKGRRGLCGGISQRTIQITEFKVVIVRFLSKLLLQSG